METKAENRPAIQLTIPEWMRGNGDYYRGNMDEVPPVPVYAGGHFGTGCRAAGCGFNDAVIAHQADGSLTLYSDFQLHHDARLDK